MKLTNRYGTFAIGFLVIYPTSAWAHLATTRFGEFYSGLLHPLISLNHILPWIAFALLAGLQTPSTARKALWVFPASVVIGVLVGTALESLFALGTLADLSAIHFAITASFAVGILVTMANRLQPKIFLLLLSAAGLVHGLANTIPTAAEQNLLLYWAGLAVIAYLVITLVTASAKAVIRSQTWGVTAVRAAGSWIVAIGVMYGGTLVLVPTVSG